LRDLSAFNFKYQYTGEPSIAPVKVFDNGEFTYFQFAKKNAEYPAIFSVDASGFESLVNFRATGDYIVVEKVSPQFTLRNGTDIVCVYNTSLYITGKAVDPYNRDTKKPPVVNNFAAPLPSQTPANAGPQGPSNVAPSPQFTAPFPQSRRLPPTIN